MIMQSDPLKSDDHRKALEAMRDILADHLRVADPNVSAQIAARLQSVLSELAALPVAVGVGVVSSLKAERDKRRSA
tara:strand:- start:1566 stop:1793 length:228 start_codon:yes stop_codon:yes gene_type:complete